MVHKLLCIIIMVMVITVFLFISLLYYVQYASTYHSAKPTQYTNNRLTYPTFELVYLFFLAQAALTYMEMISQPQTNDIRETARVRCLVEATAACRLKVCGCWRVLLAAQLLRGSTM